MANSTKCFTNVSPIPKLVKQTNNLVMGHSVKIFINKKKRRKSDNLCPVYIRVIVNRKKFEKSLGLFGNEKTFDEKTGRFVKNQRDANLIIENEIAKINEIIVRMRLSRNNLDYSKIKSQYNNSGSNEDFIEFMVNYAEEELNNGHISEGRYKRYLVVANKLRAFTSNGKLPFNELNKEFIDSFKSNEKKYLDKLAKTQGRGSTNTLNTIATGLKILKKVCKEAVIQDLMVSNPFDTIKIQSVKVEKTSLSIGEVKKLLEIRKKKSLNPMLHESLEQFIFAIFTGIRFSDLKLIGTDNIEDGVLTFIAKKTKKHGTKARVPLLDTCKEIIKGRSSPFFPKYDNQPFNRNLKIIAQIAEIKKPITAHIARHTFISLYLRSGGKIEVAQQFTALTNIKQVLEYNKIFDDQLFEEINKLNILIN